MYSLEFGIGQSDGGCSSGGGSRKSESLESTEACHRPAFEGSDTFLTKGCGSVHSYTAKDMKSRSQAFLSRVWCCVFSSVVKQRRQADLGSYHKQSQANTREPEAASFGISKGYHEISPTCSLTFRRRTILSTCILEDDVTSSANVKLCPDEGGPTVCRFVRTSSHDNLRRLRNFSQGPQLRLPDSTNASKHHVTRHIHSFHVNTAVILHVYHTRSQPKY